MNNRKLIAKVSGKTVFLHDATTGSGTGSFTAQDRIGTNGPTHAIVQGDEVLVYFASGTVGIWKLSGGGLRYV